MSLNGFGTYEKNVRKLIKSEVFKKSDFREKLEIGYRFLNSEYGLGSFFGFGEVKELLKKQNKE